jgi:hypothetical protein
MTILRTLTAAAIVTTLAATSAYSQAQRLAGEIKRIEGNLVFADGRDGKPITIKLADNVVVTAVYKATVADIKPGAYIGSGAVPQADGSQKAVEVHIFAESMRGQGDGHRPGWYGADNGTMTNGGVEPGGAVVSQASGGDPVFVVKYKEGDKRIVVPPTAHIVRYEVGNKGDVKAGVQFAIQAANKQPDGTFTAERINVGRDGGRPF